MAFQNPGVVSKVMVKSGDMVKAGQLIAQQDDREEQSFLAVKLKELKAAEWQIKAADADLAKKRVDLDRNEKLYAEQLRQDPNFSNTELDEARVNVKIGEIAVEYRKVELEQKKAEIDAAKVKAEQRKLVSPIDGVVAKVEIHAGEGTDLAKPAGVLIVSNEPLWVEVNVPSIKTVSLGRGAKLPVRYIDGGGDGAWVMGEVIYLADLGNAGTSYRMVRLQMPNTARREAGLQVYVRLPDAAAPTAASAGEERPAAVQAAQLGQ
jgi:RND family efflux transporter MFP subunit